MDIALYDGDREALRPLFRLADDAEAQIERCLRHGEVLVAREHGALVGHLQLVDTDEPDVVEVTSMAVVEARRGSGLGRALVTMALAHARGRGVHRVLVATGAADVGNLRFYQRLGFRMLRIERDAFTPAHGYPEGLEVDGIPLRDRVWLDRAP